MENKSGLPAYAKVYEEIKNNILKGTYAPGTLIPPEHELEKLYFVSRTTVRKAVSMLANEGLVSIKQGYGTEVLDRKITQNLNTITSISQTLQKKGYKIGTKSMYIRVITAKNALCSELELPKNSKVVEINRIQTTDGLPVCISKNYISYERVKGIENETSKIVSLYKYLEDNYKIVLDSSKDVISACVAGFEDSELLQIEPGTAILTNHRICYFNNKPVEVDDVKILAEKYSFEIYTHS